MRCAHCGSPEVQTGFDKYNCLSCGELTTVGGLQVRKEQRELNEDEYQALLNREHEELIAAHEALKAEHEALKEQHNG